MRRLILFRHAKAEARLAGQEDIDRPLAARGRADALLIAQVLAREGLSPDLALVSASRRTRDTWDCAKGVFANASAAYLDDLYNAAAEEVLAEVETHAAEAGTIMVIGHNPGLHELAVNLLIDGGASAAQIDRMAVRFPTATAAAFQVDADGRAAFDGLFLARDHGGEGE